MEIPKPVPSILRFFSSSRRVKEIESLLISSARIPIPVSITLTKISMLSISTETTLNVKVTEPSCVYLIALVNKFVTTCLIRTSSPKSMRGNSESMSTIKFKPFLLARSAAIFSKSLINITVS